MATKKQTKEKDYKETRRPLLEVCYWKNGVTATRCYGTDLDFGTKNDKVDNTVMIVSGRDEDVLFKTEWFSWARLAHKR